MAKLVKIDKFIENYNNRNVFGSTSGHTINEINTMLIELGLGDKCITRDTHFEEINEIAHLIYKHGVREQKLKELLDD